MVVVERDHEEKGGKPPVGPETLAWTLFYIVQNTIISNPWTKS
jgi:hypothetical protein